jgi:hypothetical protein
VPPPGSSDRVPETRSGPHGNGAGDSALTRESSLVRTHLGLGPAEEPDPVPKTTLPDTPEAREAAIAAAKSSLEPSAPVTTTRETPGARKASPPPVPQRVGKVEPPTPAMTASAAGKVIPFPARKDGEEIELTALEESAEGAEEAELGRKRAKGAAKKRQQAEAEPIETVRATPAAAKKLETSTLPSAQREAAAARAAVAREERAPAERDPEKDERVSDEDWHEQFFTEGDAGHYEGGPARIEAAKDEAHEIELEHKQRVSFTPQQVERRARYTRYVSGIVGFLIAVAGVAGIRSWVRSNDAATSAQALEELPPPIVTAAPPEPKPVDTTPTPPEPEPTEVISLDEPEPPVAKEPKPAPPVAAETGPKPVKPKPPPLPKPPPVAEPPPTPPTPPGTGAPPTASFPTE